METFEEIRKNKNVIYKLKGKLSENKEANIMVVPKTKLLYMYINDNRKAYKMVSLTKLFWHIQGDGDYN